MREMEEPDLCGSGGPPRSPCRRRPQTTPSCCGQEPGGERRGKSRAVSAAGVDHEGERERTTDEASKDRDDVETRESLRPWDESGGCLLIGQAVSGVEVARAWSGLLCGTCEPAPRWGGRPVERLWPAAGCLERELRAAETARGRVAMRGAGADRLVVAVKPGNAGGAKGTGRPGLLSGQPRVAGGAG